MAKSARLIAHPQHTEWKASWLTAKDVYEGAGGFQDPTRPYLVPHPREWLDHSIVTAATSEQPASVIPNPNPRNPSPKLVMRRKLARYENVAATILDTVTGALFTEPPTRTASETAKLAPWWNTNCDGLGTPLSAFMQDAWVTAAVFGHAVLVLDKAPQEAATQADQQLPRLSRYTPLDLIDWLEDDNGKVTAVKLLEAAPRTSFEDRITSTDYRVRVITETEWTLFDAAGKPLETAAHGFETLPVVWLYGKRRVLTPHIGKSVMGDPFLFIDLYNLVSEVRELLRNQTFAILNVPIGKEGSVSAEQALLGQQTGTNNVMFSSNAAQYISPDSGNVEAYHEHIDRLGRMIYRLAAVPWDGDSRDAESAESRQIKRGDMDATLRKYVAELQRADDAVVDLAYRAMFGASWEKQKKADAVACSYSQRFDTPDMEAVAARAAEAIALDLGPTATKEIKKRTVRVMLPNLDPVVAKLADAEIEGQQILTAAERQQQMLDAAAIRLADSGPQDKGGEDDPVPAEPEAA